MSKSSQDAGTVAGEIGDEAPDSAAEPTEEATEEPAEQSRYSIREVDEERIVTCGSSPNIHLHVRRGLTIEKKQLKKYPQQTIFLDGVFSGAPFLDNRNRQYSFDHHADCVRAFTLATCEQTAVMLLQGLPLDEGAWNVYINEPDLDATLSAWLLMNHLELLAANHKLLGDVMPFVRVEGVIDAHGLDKATLSGLPEADYQAQVKRIDAVRESESGIKGRGEWAEADLVAFTQGLLSRLDHELYPEKELAGLLELTEIRKLPLPDKKIALLCSSQQGIYQVERQLKQRYDKQLGLIVLDLGEGRFTLRQTDPFLKKDLRDLYKALNRQDLRARQTNQKNNRWGGSEDIGGSPRQTGSALDGMQVLEVVAKVYGQGGGWFKRLFSR